MKTRIVQAMIALASLAAGAAYADATVVSVKGTATTWTGTEPRRALKVGDTVRGGDHVATSAGDSTLTLKFEDNTMMVLRPNSTLKLKPKCVPGEADCPAKSTINFKAPKTPQ